MNINLEKLYDQICKRNKLFKIGTEIGIIDEVERILSFNIMYYHEE